jgi:hypothetical protein
LSREPRADGDRSADAIRRDIERRRESIARTVDQASRKIRESLSWREQVRQRPYGAVALAAATGFVLATLLRSRTSVGERAEAALASGVREIGHSLRDALGRVGERRHGLAGALGTALTAVATQSAASAAWQRFAREAPRPNTEIPTPASPPRAIIKERRYA